MWILTSPGSGLIFSEKGVPIGNWFSNFTREDSPDKTRTDHSSAKLGNDIQHSLEERDVFQAKNRKGDGRVDVGVRKSSC